MKIFKGYVVTVATCCGPRTGEVTAVRQGRQLFKVEFSDGHPCGNWDWFTDTAVTAVKRPTLRVTHRESGTEQTTLVIVSGDATQRKIIENRYATHADTIAVEWV